MDKNDKYRLAFDAARMEHFINAARIATLASRSTPPRETPHERPGSSAAAGRL
jgi:hypothetical protein